MTCRRGDLLAVLGVAEQLAAVEHRAVGRPLPCVASVVGAACVIYHHWVMLTGEFRQVDVGWAEGGFTLSGLRPLAALAHEHPAIQHQRQVIPRKPPTIGRVPAGK